jgi:very-short-patch-repair endonuclease
MTTTGRRSATSDGQRFATPATLRRRDLSGVRFGSLAPLTFLRNLDLLNDVVESVGQPCWATGPTNAALFGVDGVDLVPPFDLAVPRGRAPHALGHHIHRLRDISRLDTDTALGIPCLSATRLLIESSRSVDAKQLTVLLDCTLRDGLTSEDFLHRRIVELRRKGRAGLDRLLAVVEGAERSRGGHSWLERTFLELLGDLGLQRPDTQQVLARRDSKLVRVDCQFPGTPIVIELLGYRHHRSVAQMQVDAERSNALTLAGFEVFQFTYDDVVLRSQSMLTTLRTLRNRTAT